jgi:hypothetical protein
MNAIGGGETEEKNMKEYWVHDVQVTITVNNNDIYECPNPKYLSNMNKRKHKGKWTMGNQQCGKYEQKEAQGDEQWGWMDVIIRQDYTSLTLKSQVIAVTWCNEFKLAVNLFIVYLLYW